MANRLREYVSKFFNRYRYTRAGRSATAHGAQQVQTGHTRIVLHTQCCKLNEFNRTHALRARVGAAVFTLSLAYT